MKKSTLIALAAALMVAQSFPAVAQSKEAIRIGAVLSTTGPAGYLGDPQLKTLQTYLAQINQDGGVLVGTRNPSTQSIARSFVPAPLDDLLGTLRVDWRQSAGQDITLRYSGQRENDVVIANIASV